MYLRGHAASVFLGALGAASVVGEGAGPDLRYDMDRRGTGAGRFPSLSTSFFSALVGMLGMVAVLPQSKAVPGVFGVLAADPNDAKAPDPRPNADEAPEVGEATELAVNGAFELKGLPFPPDVLPKRRGPGGAPSLPSCRSDLSMERDSCPALFMNVSQTIESGYAYGGTHFGRRLRRFSLSMLRQGCPKGSKLSMNYYKDCADLK